MKSFAEQFNLLKVVDDGITPMETFVGTTTCIYPQNHHTWGCPVFVLDAILKGKISVPPNLDPLSSSGIYLGHPPFCEGLVALVTTSGISYHEGDNKG